MDEWRDPPEVGAGRLFDPHDVGTECGQRPGGRGARDQLGEVEDPNTLEQSTVSIQCTAPAREGRRSPPAAKSPYY